MLFFIRHSAIKYNECFTNVSWTYCVCLLNNGTHRNTAMSVINMSFLLEIVKSSLQNINKNIFLVIIKAYIEKKSEQWVYISTHNMNTALVINLNSNLKQCFRWFVFNKYPHACNDSYGERVFNSFAWTMIFYFYCVPSLLL